MIRPVLYEVSQKLGYPFRGPHNRDYSIFGSMLGSPYLGKLSYCGLHEHSIATSMDTADTV